MRAMRLMWGLAGACVLMMVVATGGCREQPGGVKTASTMAAPIPPAPAAVSAPAMRRVNVLISGHVQGVGFRAFTDREARRLALGGWVANLPDGRVQAVIEGPAGKVASLLELLRQGPQGARVDELEITDQPVQGDAATFRVNQ